MPPVPPPKHVTPEHILHFVQDERTASDLADWCHRHGFRSGQAREVLLSLVASGQVVQTGKTRQRFVVATHAPEPTRPTKRRASRAEPQALALPGIL